MAVTTANLDHMNGLVEIFHANYEIVSADTPELREQAYRLRHLVYCQYGRIPGFDDLGKFHGDIETDAYDERALHILLRYRPSGKFVGNVRLVLPDERNPASKFPMEELMGHAFHTQARVDSLPRRHLAEVSRLVLVRHLPRATLTSSSGKTYTARAGSRLCANCAVLGLVRGLIRLSAECGVTHWYATMEPSLIRLLKRFGISFREIGPLVDCHGSRLPFARGVSNLLDDVYQENPEVWDLLTDYGNHWPAEVAKMRALG